MPGLMRTTLLWANCSRVSKATITRHLNAADRGMVVASANWDVVAGHANAAKSQWWYTTVVPRLVALGLGTTERKGDGDTYHKPTAADLTNAHVVNSLSKHLQLTAEEVARTTNTGGVVPAALPTAGEALLG